MKTGYRYVYAKPKGNPTLAICMRRYIVQELKTLVVVVDNAVGEVDQQLGEAALRGRIVAENRGEGGIAKRLGEALPEGLAGASIVTETIFESAFVSRIGREYWGAHRRKQRTTCFKSLAVCCSTSWLTMLLRTVPTA